MKRLRPNVLVVIGLLVLTACGSTVQGAGSQLVPANNGLAVPGVGDQGLGPDVPAAVPGGVAGVPSRGGDAVAQAEDARPGAGGSSSPGRGVNSAAGAPQVVPPGASTKQPIQIGVLVTDTTGFQAVAGGTSFTLLTRDAIRAYIRAINTAGGVAGRKLEVVDYTFNYTSANYDNEFQAACAEFTEDNHVGAVIYDAMAYNQTLNTCLTKAGVPLIYMHQVGTQVGDSTDFGKHAGMITAGSVNIDRRLRAILDGAITQGFLRSGSKLGVIVETCPYHLRAYDRTLTPIATRSKITVFRTDVDCGAGSADHGTGIGAVQSAVLRYKGEGVDSIMFVTNYENGTVFYFAAAAEGQDYRPQYLLWHNQGCPDCMAFFQDQGFGAQLEKMRGFGSSPLWDVTYPPAPPPAQAAVRRSCLSTAERQGVGAADANTQAVVLDACDSVNLLRRALTLSDGQGGTRAVVSAVERLGTDFVSTMVLEGSTRFGPGLHDGTAMAAVSVYQAKCECITYITSPKPIP